MTEKFNVELLAILKLYADQFNVQHTNIMELNQFCYSNGGFNPSHSINSVGASGASYTSLDVNTPLDDTCVCFTCKNK